MGNWKKFWFEGNLYFGWVKSIDDWRKAVEIYGEHFTPLSRLLEAREAPHETNRYPKFGFASECCGKLTLGEWAKQNGMDLEIELDDE
ncbi:hypothetical protein KJ885_00360 [Patescibacteria group bacterium]|nr:hypothetical protein [Patescibacteria group bacterium]